MCSIPCDVKGSNCAFCPSSKEMAHGFTFCVSAKEILKSQLSMNSDHVTLKRRPTHSMNRLETNCSGSSLHRPGLGLVCRFLSNCVSRRSCQLTSFSHCAKQQQLTVMSSGLWLASTWRGRPYLSLFFCLSVQTQRCVTETKKKNKKPIINFHHVKSVRDSSQGDTYFIYEYAAWSFLIFNKEIWYFCVKYLLALSSVALKYQLLCKIIIVFLLSVQALQTGN